MFLGKEGREFWWVAPVSSVASIAFKRLKRGIPAYFVRSIISSPGKESTTLINGAVIRFKSGENANSLYGEDVWAAVIDEASHEGRCLPCHPLHPDRYPWAGAHHRER
ncbi:hypothetical protein HFN68_24230 [Rhizobium laguerreae]|uniref:hypothetical protein n=1 Tax=Rhizobium laguerreae TaxID=1076926 RepID=UPI001C91692E|nr:hypothetical protein [Rhizobium laguerreae]MBY3535997.1 hypothetical protein [Rhizobium laguerreae]